MHDAAPSAVTIAVAIDAIICTINLMVSLLLITQFFNFKILPLELCSLGYAKNFSILNWAGP